MYGKIFGTMFEGSLVGSGPLVFALMSYVIAKQVPDKVVGSQVRLSPAILATTFGVKEAEVKAAIKFLCSPDENSSSPEEDGRRLVQLSKFEYRVVNGKKYLEIRNEEERREQNRRNQAAHRGRVKAKKSQKQEPAPLPDDPGDSSDGEISQDAGAPVVTKEPYNWPLRLQPDGAVKAFEAADGDPKKEDVITGTSEGGKE